MHRMRRLREAIVCVLRFPRDFDEAGAPEVGEMARHERLGQLEDVDQVAHAELAGGEQVQDPQPGRVGESAEERFEIGDDRGGERWGQYDLLSGDAGDSNMPNHIICVQAHMKVGTEIVTRSRSCHAAAASGWER